MGRGALWRDNQQSTFAHIHTSSSHSTTSPWSPIPYPHCLSTQGGIACAFTALLLSSMSRTAQEKERGQYALNALGKKKPSSTVGTQLYPSSENASNYSAFS